MTAKELPRNSTVLNEKARSINEPVDLLILLLWGCGNQEPDTLAGKPASGEKISTVVFPDVGAYTGAYIDFGDY